jgi:hypothetical protein
MTMEYKAITRDQRINFINNDNYKGYWDGGYISPLLFSGVYNDFLRNKKTKATYTWDDKAYINGRFTNTQDDDKEGVGALWATYYNITHFIKVMKRSTTINNRVYWLGIKYSQNIDDIIIIMKPGFYYKYKSTQIHEYDKEIEINVYNLSQYKIIKKFEKDKEQKEYRLYCEEASLYDIYYILIPKKFEADINTLMSTATYRVLQILENKILFSEPSV